MKARAAWLAAALALALPAGGGAAEVIEQVLVKVNGEIFTKSELEERQITALRQLGRQLDAASDPTGAELRRALEEITPALMVEVVDEFLTVQRGRELGYALGDEQFQSILADIKEDNQIKTDEEFQAALKQERMTLDDLRRRLERTMIASRVQQAEVLGRIAVSEEEARRYYETHLDEFTTPRTVTLLEFLAAVPPDVPGSEEAARQKADDVHRRALAGESFEALIEELSDSASRANAGLIGPLSVGELAPDLRARISALGVGGLTEVVRTARGFQILQLDSSTPAQTTPFLQARDEIGQRVFTRKRQEELQKYMEQLRARAIIEWRNPELERAFEIGLQQMRTGQGR